MYILRHSFLQLHGYSQAPENGREGECPKQGGTAYIYLCAKAEWRLT